MRSRQNILLAMAGVAGALLMQAAPAQACGAYMTHNPCRVPEPPPQPSCLCRTLSGLWSGLSGSVRGAVGYAAEPPGYDEDEPPYRPVYGRPVPYDDDDDHGYDGYRRPVPVYRRPVVREPYHHQVRRPREFQREPFRDERGPPPRAAVPTRRWPVQSTEAQARVMPVSDGRRVPLPPRREAPPPAERRWEDPPVRR